MAAKREKPEDIVTKLRQVKSCEVKARRLLMRCVRSGDAADLLSLAQNGQLSDHI